MNKDILYLDNLMSIKSKAGIIENKFSWLYLFSNENISAFYKKIDLKDKKVLTVTGSGDHILNAFLSGAKSVDAFDINPLAKYFSELKIAAIKSLSYEEFILFFDNQKIFNSKNFFNKNIYISKIRNFLNEEEKKFWDYLFNKYNSSQIRKSYLFTDDQLFFDTCIKINDYLNNKDNYYLLRNILKDKKVYYFDMNIKDINKIDKAYDLIILSNIANYLNNIYDKEHLKKFRELIGDLKKNNAQVVVSYLYYNSIKTNEDNYIYLRKDVDNYFNQDDFQYIKFDSVSKYEYPTYFGSDNREDEILISKK